MSTKHGLQNPAGEFVNKDDKGGDEHVKYAGGKRQHKSDGVNYVRGKLPQGEFHGRVVTKDPTMFTGK